MPPSRGPGGRPGRRLFWLVLLPSLAAAVPGHGEQDVVAAPTDSRGTSTAAAGLAVLTRRAQQQIVYGVATVHRPWWASPAHGSKSSTSRSVAGRAVALGRQLVLLGSTEGSLHGGIVTAIGVGVIAAALLLCYLSAQQSLLRMSGAPAAPRRQQGPETEVMWPASNALVAAVNLRSQQASEQQSPVARVAVPSVATSLVTGDADFDFARDVFCAQYVVQEPEGAQLWLEGTFSSLPQQDNFVVRNLATRHVVLKGFISEGEEVEGEGGIWLEHSHRAPVAYISTTNAVSQLAGAPRGGPASGPRQVLICRAPPFSMRDRPLTRYATMMQEGSCTCVARRSDNPDHIIFTVNFPHSGKTADVLDSKGRLCASMTHRRGGYEVRVARGADASAIICGLISVLKLMSST